MYQPTASIWAVNLLQDFYVFNTATFMWINLTAATGAAPSPRAGHGLVAAEGRIYIHGGFGQYGRRGPMLGCCSILTDEKPLF